MWMLIACVFSINFASSTASKSRVASIYDLSKDSSEKKNLINTVKYSPYVSTIEERISYFESIRATPEIPSYSVSKKAWNSCGGICPWIETTYTVEDTSVIFKSTKKDNTLPNIVFISIDDWGYNDLGYQSTYMDWTTPTIDAIAEEGIILENYFTHPMSLPSRGALLTGRYQVRLGLYNSDYTTAELPLNESTIAQELKSAGYRNYYIGKWGLGMSTEYHNPLNRGFDYFYGHLSDSIDYYTKETSSGYLDLREGLNLVTSSSEISSDLHLGYLLQSKAEDIISKHVDEHKSSPMFLLYSIPIMSGGIDSTYSAPSQYLDRCSKPSVDDGLTDETLINNLHNYCGLNLMLDEMIGNLTCSLHSNGLADNTYLIITSTNGGNSIIPGNNYPFHGGKGDHRRGGVGVNSIIHSNLISWELQGEDYSGYMHVTGI